MPSFPHYHQLDQMDCGPTCLRMVAKHYGKSYSLPYLRERSYITRNGVSFASIAEGAEYIGMRTLAVKISFEKLEKDAQLPIIVQWNQNHFVVVYRITSRHVYVADPSMGLLTYTREAFLKSWAGRHEKGWGSALLLAPTPAFLKEPEDEPEKDEKNKKSGWGVVWGYILQERPLLGQLVLSLLFAFSGVLKMNGVFQS